MATILGKQTVNNTLILSVSTDPTTSGGTVAPVGSIALAVDGSGTFIKNGSADTSWGITYPITTSTISITGLTQIDMTGLSGIVTVILTSSNATETINKIVNATNVYKIIFQPQSGLQVTFNDKSIGGVGANIHLFASTQIPNGTNSGYLEVTLRSSEWYQTGFIDSYN
jgi:hypothetical protein